MSMKRKEERKTVVVGTCRVESHAWIAGRRTYSLPLPKGATGAGHASVTHKDWLLNHEA